MIWINAAVELQASMTREEAIYYLSSIRDNIWMLLVIVSLHSAPATLQLANVYSDKSICEKEWAKTVNTLFKVHCRKNEVLHWRFLQQMWVNPQFPVTICGLSACSFIKNELSLFNFFREFFDGLLLKTLQQRYMLKEIC